MRCLLTHHLYGFVKKLSKALELGYLEVTFLLSLLGSWKEITVYSVNLMSPWQEVAG